MKHPIASRRVYVFAGVLAFATATAGFAQQTQSIPPHGKLTQGLLH